MAGSVNITRAEALERSELITAHSYKVIVDLTGHDIDGTPLPHPDVNFVSTTTARFTSSAGRSWIDLIADEIVDSYLDGKQLDVADYDGARLALELSEGERQLTVTALCRYSRTGEGLHRFVDPVDERTYLYTQFETADARRMYACFDQPNLKATFEIAVHAPGDWKVYSNSPSPEPQPADNGVATWQFAATPGISTYITALVAGQFYAEHRTIRSGDREIGADFVCRESMKEFLETDQMCETTQRGFEIYEQAFGRPYAFEKYDQLFLPEYNAGAMENAGCVTFRDDYLFRSRVTANEYSQRDNTILHELAHMWFGDLVTMTWWDDLWLNESFAEWASTWCQSEIVKTHGGQDSWTTFANKRKLWAYTTDQLPTTHPIAADMFDLETVDQNFDGITYAKGASVLKQLVAYVGPDQFFEGVRAYFAEHAWGNTQFADLVGALERASGRDLSQFASHWLESSGVNVVRPQFEIEDGRYANFGIAQSGSDVLRTHRMAIGLYDIRDGKIERRDLLEVDVHDDVTPIAVLNGVEQPDLLVLNDQDLSYVKVRLDDRSLATVREHLGDVPDPLTRAVIWTSLWDTWRDAELASGDYADIICRGLAGEDDPTAIINNIGQALAAATSYSEPNRRDEIRSRVTGALASTLKEAEPGSDKQVAVANGLIAMIDSPAGCDLLKGWLVDEEVPEGLEIDADKRWAICTTLARLGQIDDKEIAAELERDNTISGAEKAAGARAARNDAEAKAEAWRLATEEADVPNGTHLAIASNFWKFGQEELTADYAERYLQLVDDIAASRGVWAQRGHTARQTALLHLFPKTVADEEFCTRLESWLGAHDVAGQVRRILVNQIDHTRREIAARSFSAQH